VPAREEWGTGVDSEATSQRDPGASGRVDVVVVGAGPAGLTAAYQLTKAGKRVLVLEADDVVGGISRTVVRDGWRFDVGGHRFFTKVRAVSDLWHEILPPDEFLVRPRLSRIFYNGKFYDYPIKPVNALRNLGTVEALRCLASYFRVQLRPPADQTSLEGYVVARYGRRLYTHFFKTYNEKVWGVPASELSADFGAQRIKGMSLFQVVWEPMRSRFFGARGDRAKQVTSLIEEFEYPKYGPGMMWEACRNLVEDGGGRVEMSSPVVVVHRGAAGASAVSYRSIDGDHRVECDHVISSMPLSGLVDAMDPPAPTGVREAARELRYRDFIVVALVVPSSVAFPDNWIYVHQQSVRVGRIQNFGAWSPFMVRAGSTCLGLEYFVFEGDQLWEASDDRLVALATSELEEIGLVAAGDVERGFVVRMPKAYPVYDDAYASAVDTIRTWLGQEVANVHPVGRNGMHKYNNQDHSMYTAMLTVENITADTHHDVWAVNVDDVYHETDDGRTPPILRGGTEAGTGRLAPVVPRPPRATGPEGTAPRH